MSNEKHIHLSDLLDDQVSDEALEQLLASSEQGKTWYRYQAVHAVLKNEHSAYSSFDFTQRMSQLIADEPAIIARAAQSTHGAVPETQPTNQVFSFPALMQAEWKKVSGLALAASIAFATVFSVQMGDDKNLPLSINTSSLVASETNTASFPGNNNLAGEMEQARLEEIQAYLDRINRNDVHEQLVGGEYWTRSYVIETKDDDSLEARVRKMRKPSDPYHKPN